MTTKFQRTMTPHRLKVSAPINNNYIDMEENSLSCSRIAFSDGVGERQVSGASCLVLSHGYSCRASTWQVLSSGTLLIPVVAEALLMAQRVEVHL